MHCNLTYKVVTDEDAMEAVKRALRLGAAAARADQLRAIMDSQRSQGYGQLADSAQAEIEALDRGVAALIAVKRAGD